MTGFSRDELIGTAPPHPYWPPEEMDAIRAAMAATLAGGSDTFPLTFMRKSGERFPVLVTPSAVLDEDGTVTCAFAVVKDMTEVRRAEAALAESDRLFRLTFDQAPVGAVLVGLDFRFRRVNDAFCRMLRYTAEELLRRTFRDVSHPDDDDVDEPAVRRMVAGVASEYRREKRYVRKDGEIAWGDVQVLPVRAADGSPLALLAMIQDVTDRKREQDAAARLMEEVRQERDKLSALLDSIPDEIWFSDTAGTFTLANAAALDEFGVATGADVRRMAAELEVHRSDGTLRPVEEAPPLRALAGELCAAARSSSSRPATASLASASSARHRSPTPLESSRDA